MLLKFLQKCLRLCFYCIASIVISLAVALVVLRITLPDLGAFKTDIEAFIGEQMGQPVAIDKIYASWNGWIPNLELEQIHIFDRTTRQQIVGFDNARIAFDLLSSLWQRTLVPSDILISGTQLTFARQADGSIIIVESGTHLSAGETDNQALTRWFEQQKDIILKDARLTWVDQQTGRPPLQFENTAINLSSDQQQIIANGTADLLQGKNRATIRFDVNLHGDISSDGWSGTINASTDQFFLGQLLQQQSLFHIDMIDHPGNVQVMSRFKNARLKQLAATVRYDLLQFGNDAAVTLRDTTINLDALHRDDSQWVVDMSFENRTDDNIIYKGTSLRAISGLDNQNRRSVNLAVNYVPLKNILAISRHIAELKNFAIAKSIDDGELHNLRIGYRAPTTQGAASTSQQHKLTMALDKVIVRSPEIYDSDTTLSDMNADLLLNTDDKLSDIGIQRLVFNTEDFPVSIEGNISAGQQTDIDLSMTIERLPIASLPAYLPKTADPLLKEWVDAGLLDGNASDIQLTAKGPLAEFPFANDKAGQLRLSAEVEQAKILYQPGWPILDKVDGSLALAGSELTMQLRQAEILSASVEATRAWIPDVLEDDPTLYVQGNVAAAGELLSTFIDNSPLQNQPSLQIIKQIDIKGPTAIRLDLDIPLYPEDLTVIDGTLSFMGNSIDAEELDMQMTALTGDIHFTRHAVFSDTITADYFDGSVNLNIPKVADGEAEYILISGQMDRPFIKQQLRHYVPEIIDDINPYLDYISGQGHWQARYSLANNNAADSLRISSDLQGIQLSYPQPLNKAAEQPLALTLDIPLTDTSQNPLVIDLGQLLNAKIRYIDIDDNDSRLTSLTVNFGTETQSFRFSDRIELRGNITTLELSAWMDLVSSVDAQLPDSGFDPSLIKPGLIKPGLLDPVSIFNNKFAQIEIETLYFAGQRFGQVSAVADQQQGDWNISLSGEDIQGSIGVPQDDADILVNLSQLRIQPSTTEDDAANSLNSNTLNPTNLPTLEARVEQLYYADRPLGKLELALSRLDDGLAIDQLALSSDSLELVGNGQWISANGQSKTALKVDVNADSVNGLLQHFNLEPSSIEDGELALQIATDWTGSPFELNLASLSGDIFIDIATGSILDINPKAGRLFGLLSIQSLPRRLSLDFSDLFGKGLQFDSISGHFSITDGQAFTNDLVLQGSTAHIAVSGRAGLVEQDYDQIVTVTPKVTGTLPVAGALFGPLGVGVGTAIYFAGELFESIPEGIDNLLQIKYTITGSWEQPKVSKYRPPDELIQVPLDNPSTLSEAIKK